MKQLIILLSIVFIYTYALSQEDSYLNFIQKNGEVIRINAEELDSIYIQNKSNTGFMHIILTDSTMVYSLKSINKINILKSSGKIDSLSIKQYDGINYWGYLVYKITNLPINKIESIMFSNYNEFQNIIYSNIKIDILNLQAVYKNDANPLEFSQSYSIENGTDNVGGNNEVFCTKYKLIMMGTLFFSSKQSTSSYYHDYETCSENICYLYIDTVNKIIDSLLIGLESKQFTIPSAGGRWREENTTYEDVKLLALPYTKDINNDIIVDFSLKDLSQIKYEYYSKHLSGSSGGYDVSENSFKNFLPPSDSSKINIRISP